MLLLLRSSLQRASPAAAVATRCGPVAAQLSAAASLQPSAAQQPVASPTHPQQRQRCLHSVAANAQPQLQHQLQHFGPLLLLQHQQPQPLLLRRQFSSQAPASNAAAAAADAADTPAAETPAAALPPPLPEEEQVAMQLEQQQHIVAEESLAALKQRLAKEKRAVLKGMPGQLLKQPLFWNNLSSKIASSRKPAIKAPARHQWRYCAEDYDAMEPAPKQQLPPYAPLKAHTKDYREIYFKTRPQWHRRSYWRVWRKNVAIADQRWKQAWEAKMAEARKYDEQVKRLSERIIRERSWQVWQLQKAAGAGAGGSGRQSNNTA